METNLLRCTRCFGTGEIKGPGFMMTECPKCGGMGQLQMKQETSSEPKKRGPAKGFKRKVELVEES